MDEVQLGLEPLDQSPRLVVFAILNHNDFKLISIKVLFDKTVKKNFKIYISLIGGKNAGYSDAHLRVDNSIAFEREGKELI
jgi:hypothetical protein